MNINKFFIKLLLQYSHILPYNIFNNFFSYKNNLIQQNLSFNTFQYEMEYKATSLIQFFLPLLLNLSKISQDISSLLKEKKIVHIVSVIFLFDSITNRKFMHSLSISNQLYTLENIDKWSINIVYSLIEKLELYNSFQKISIDIKVIPITKI
jgi:hypothetical protein